MGGCASSGPSPGVNPLMALVPNGCPQAQRGGCRGTVPLGDTHGKSTPSVAIVAIWDGDEEDEGGRGEKTDSF